MLALNLLTCIEIKRKYFVVFYHDARIKITKKVTDAENPPSSKIANFVVTFTVQ